MTDHNASKITSAVLKRWSEVPNPRLSEVMQGYVRHMHAFVSEVRPTEAEWAAAIGFLTRIGKTCDDKRQEFILFSDVTGVSMLVDAINNPLEGAATPTTVEGPFHIADSPAFEAGSNMAEGCPGIPCFVSGTVKSTDGKPIAGAALDVWQSDGEGLYEAQLGTDKPWMRGVFRSGADGAYGFRTVAPIDYSIPMDGPVGELVRAGGVSHIRPAHVHFCVEAPGYRRIVTHLFRGDGSYLENDAVYAVKAPLIAEFKKHRGGTAPDGSKISGDFMTVDFDFVMQRA
jgi:hydroxyquinol 1,2-dioxygenase